MDKEVVFAVQLWSEVPPWLTRVVFKGSYRNPEVKDERVGSESTVGRVEWDEEKHVNEDLQALDPKPSFIVHATMLAAFSRIDNNIVIEHFRSPCGPLSLKSPKDRCG